MKKIAALLMVFAMMASLVACASSSPSSSVAAAPSSAAAVEASSAESSKTADKGQYKVLIGASNMSGSFYSWLANSCAAQLEKLDVHADIVDLKSDSANVPTLIEQAISGGYTGLIMDVPDQDQDISKQLQEAKDNGVYTVLVNNATKPDGICSHVGLDNYTLGKNIGKVAAEKIAKNASGLIMKATPGNTGSEDRYKGFVDALKEAGRTDVKVLGVQNSKDWSKEGAMAVMEDWTQVYPKFDFVYAPCDDMVCGAIETCQAAGYDLKNVQFYGIDGLANGCTAVKKGTLTATILQNADDEATTAAKALHEMMDGTNTKSQLFALDGTVVTKDNVEDIIAMHTKNGMMK